MGNELTASTLQVAKDVRKAWERFLSGDETLQLEKVRPAIRASWQRSKSFGVDPTVRKLPITLESEEVARRYEHNSPLVLAGREVFTFVSQQLLADAFTVGVTDHEGNLLYAEAPPRFDWRNRLNVVPGAGLQERFAGTNAVAMALQFDQPFQMYWYEHYAEVGHEAGGGAVPIHGCCGETLGTVGIAGYGDSVHPRLFHLLAFAARLFEKNIGHDEELAHFEVLKEFNRCQLKFPESLLLALCPHGRILALSRSLAKLVALPQPEGLIGRPLHEVQDFHLEGLSPSPGGESSKPYESLLSFPYKGKSCTSTVVPISREGQNAGLVVIASEPSPPTPKIRTKSLWQVTHTFTDLIGESPAFRSVVTLARRAASHNWPILLIGESGTGKELFAQAIHCASRRALGPFVALNVSTIPKELVTSELFGYEEGAFSGALRGGRRGKVELAHGGTLFLDELGDMSTEIQSSLLRFLEEGDIVSLGSDRPRRVDVCVIAAMNTDPTTAIEQGKLRQDLFHRINVFPIFLPPLRERTEDIPALARHLLDKEGCYATELSPEVIDIFHHYSWPGNVRELRNVLVRALAYSSNHLITSDLLPPELLSHQPPAIFPAASSRWIDRDQIQQALKACGGNLTHAAQLLHIHRATLYRKMHHCGLTREDLTEELLRAECLTYLPPPSQKS
jgi:sigma-54 dependent transcriptional regulator, acetoin dehydrogenase operon transcriptional activator AcoR